MTAYDRLRATTLAHSTAERVGETRAAMLVMVLEVLRLAGSVPVELRQALLEACRRWYLGIAEGPPLEPFRVACWEYLMARNGTSTTVSDRVDLAVRGLISVLYDEEPTVDDIDMMFDYFGSLLDRFGAG